MSWLAPLDIGVIMGLIFACPVLALATAFRLLNFPDLTIEGSLPLGAAAFGAAITSGVNLPLSIVIALVAGALAGALTAFLHVYFSVNKFLAGVLVIAVAYSVSLRILGTSNISLLQIPTIFDFTNNLDERSGSLFHWATIALLASIVASITVLFFAWLSGMSGIRTRIAGSNPEYARSLGISVPLRLVGGLAICNAVVGGCGATLAMYQGFVDVAMGQGVLIIALASMTIGERLLPKTYLSYPLFVICASVVGGVVYQVLVAYAIRFGLAPTDLRLVTAVLVLAVIIVRMAKPDQDTLDALR